MTLMAFVGLAFPVLLGVLVGATGLFDAKSAISVLNRYALYVAFPALIVAGLTDGAFEFPEQVHFWLVVPLAMGATALVLRASSADAGSRALAGLFGNVAYVGLPLCVSVLGDDVLGTASLAVSLFVLVSLVVGPVLLVRWSDTTAHAHPAAVLRQPLFWSPFVGLGLGVLPVAGIVHELVAPLGASAAPVALFLLGLYLWANRGALASGGGDAVVHVVGKLVLFPGLLAALVVGAAALGWRDVVAMQVVLLLASTPTAIAAFALAVELDVGTERVARAVVASTVVSAATLPFVVWALTAAFGPTG